MHLRVVLRDWLDVVIPARLFTSHAAQLDRALPLGIRRSEAARRLLSEVLAHESAMVRLGQLHWVDLRAQERNLGALPHRTLDLFDDRVPVALVLAEEERRGVRAALELSVGLQRAAPPRRLHL